jgi:hypothetical protein
MTPSILPALGFIAEAAWVGPTMAISLVLIALAFVAIAAAVALAGKGLAEALHGVQRASDLCTEMEPPRSVRAMSEEAQTLPKLNVSSRDCPDQRRSGTR